MPRSSRQSDFLTIIKRRKLQWYRHVSRSSGLAKTILQGTVKGGRRQGRQRKRWEDNIREWTDLEFAKSQRAVDKLVTLYLHPGTHASQIMVVQNSPDPKLFRSTI